MAVSLDVQPRAENSGRASAAPTAVPLRIVCVVPFLDEADRLPAVLGSLLAQSRFPDVLVLVDDGSRDDSAAIAGGFARAAQPKDVRLMRRATRASVRDRLADAPELRAFLWALSSLEEPWDVAVKMDADLELGADLFATLERAFHGAPDLGIAGARLSARDGRGGELVRERCPPHHVRGATKFYRRECLQEISLEPILGWDTIDELDARRRGWRTRTLDDAGAEAVHLRPIGAADGALRAQRRWGACAYGAGQHPLWVALSALRRLDRRPAVLGSCAFLAGWAGAGLRRRPRAPAAVRRFGRREQMATLRRALVLPLRTRRRRALGRLRGYPSLRWLQRRGLQVGRDAYVDAFAAFDHGFPWLISIGDEAVISAGVRLVAHDGATKHWCGYIRVGRVDIGARAYVGAHAVVLPGVRIGENAIVGAGSVVRCDVPANTVVLGNPAVQVGSVQEFAARHRAALGQRPCYPRAGFSRYEHVTPQNMRRMRAELADGCGYVE